jgi:hypothetical protein
MFLAIRQDRLGLLFVHQVEGKMRSDVTKGESHHRLLLKTVVIPSGSVFTT